MWHKIQTEEVALVVVDNKGVREIAGRQGYRKTREQNQGWKCVVNAEEKLEMP